MDKIKVLIADDEKIVREGLTNYIEWDEYNMKVVATVENGKAALDIINSQKIDLLITDIYMPVMDGMEMIGRLESLDDPPLVILISGFSDFTYAQTAIRSNIAQDYILKPLDFDQMDTVLSKVNQKITDAYSNVYFPVLDPDEWRAFTTTSANAIRNSQIEIVEKLAAGKLGQALAIFDEAIETCRHNKKSKNFIARYCIELALNACELALNQVETLALLDNDPVSAISRFSTEEEIFDYVRDIMSMVDMTLNKEVEMENFSPLIKSAFSYVNDHYSNSELSLNMIADVFSVSPGYLSNKFKEETGINFIKYLNGLRVKKAKELLKDLSLKVYMVSEKAGYEDVRYFSRIFRKYTGYTPTEYQKNLTQFIITE